MEREEKDEWFYLDDKGNRRGPHTPLEIENRMRDGRIKKDWTIQTSRGRVVRAGDMMGPEGPICDTPFRTVPDDPEPEPKKPMDKRTKNALIALALFLVAAPIIGSIAQKVTTGEGRRDYSPAPTVIPKKTVTTPEPLPEWPQEDRRMKTALDSFEGQLNSFRKIGAGDHEENCEKCRAYFKDYADKMDADVDALFAAYLEKKKEGVPEGEREAVAAEYSRKIFDLNGNIGYRIHLLEKSHNHPCGAIKREYNPFFNR